MAETDPATGVKWKDRHGIAYGKKLKHTGNIETYLSYKKLHRTGRLLKGLKVRRKQGRHVVIELYNTVSYASDHQNGATTKRARIKAPYVRSGATGVITGGNVVARPFMTPSKRILNAPKRLTEKKMRSLGWR